MPKTYRLADDAVFQKVENGGVLLSRRTGEYRQVNGTGSTVLALLNEGEVVEEILERMAEAFPAIERERLCLDVQQMLDDLSAAGVIVHD